MPQRAKLSIINPSRIFVKIEATELRRIWRCAYGRCCRCLDRKPGKQKSAHDSRRALSLQYIKRVFKQVARVNYALPKETNCDATVRG